MAKPKAAATKKSGAKPAATKSGPKAKKPIDPTPTAATATEAPFLASILANPDDKKARTIYADLLQEIGRAHV